MDKQSVHTTMRRWLNVAGQQLPWGERIEELQQIVDEAVRIYWTGEKALATMQLSQFLQQPKLLEICAQKTHLPMKIRYGSEMKIEIVRENGLAQQIDVQHIHTCTSDVYKEIVVTLQALKLQQHEITFMPFDEKTLQLEPNHFAHIVVCASAEVAKQFIQQIPKEYVSQLIVVQNDTMRLKMEALIEQHVGPYKEKKLLEGLSKLSHDLIQMTNLAAYEEAIAQLQRQYTPMLEYEKLSNRFMQLEKMRQVLESFRNTVCSTPKEIENFYTHIAPICEALAQPQLTSAWQAFVAKVAEEYTPAFQAYEASTNAFEEALRQQQKERQDLHAQWDQVKNPYIFFRKFKAFVRRINQYNSNVHSACKEEMKAVIVSGEKLTKEATRLTTELQILMTCFTETLNAASVQFTEAFRMYEAKYIEKLMQLEQHQQQAYEQIAISYPFMQELYEQVAKPTNPQAKVAQQYMHTLSTMLKPTSAVQPYTRMSIEAFYMDNPVSFRIVAHVVKEKALKQFLPKAIPSDFENYDLWLHFRRYKINAALFLSALFIGGIVVSSPYGVAKGWDEAVGLRSLGNYNIDNSGSTFEERAAERDRAYEYESSNRSTVYEEETYEEDETYTDYEDETYEQYDNTNNYDSYSYDNTTSDETTSSQTYNQNYESSSNASQYEEEDENEEYVYTYEEEEEDAVYDEYVEEEDEPISEIETISHMDVLANRALTEAEAYNASSTADTSYLSIDTVMYSGDGAVSGVTGNDDLSKKYLVDAYATNMQQTMNGYGIEALTKFLAPGSAIYSKEEELFTKLLVLQEGTYNLVNVQLDPNNTQSSDYVEAIQTFEYINPAGDSSFFEVRSTFSFTHDGSQLYISNIERQL